jgi:hypothetical protein
MHSISVPEHASFADYSRAMDEAKSLFRPALERRSFYLGIFHDDELHRIDLDPVAVVDSIADVESIGAYTRAIGGAYHFKSGDGFWPPHVAEGAAMATPDNVHFAGPGQWRSQAEAVQAPEPEEEDGEDEPPTISAQILQFGVHFNPMELRDSHGRWTRGATEQLKIGKLLRAAADPFVGAPLPHAEELHATAVTEASRAAKIMPGLMGSKNEIWNGKAKIYPMASKPEILAELDWDGTLNMADNVAAAIGAAREHPDDPVRNPDAFEVLGHEMIHGVVPPGTEAANKRAYQDYATAQIEEGFTELGATYHAPEFLDAMGIGDRQAGLYPGHTVRQLAEEISGPDEIARGNAWKHYPQQTKDAQDWVQLVAQEEGQTGHEREVYLADEVNRQGAAGKVAVMAQQLAHAMTKSPKMSNDAAFMTELRTTIEASIAKQWSVGQGKAAFTSARNAAIQKVSEKEREMAEQAA